MNDKAEYKIKTFPASRIGTFDIGVVSRMKHHIKALIELDVTNARKLIKEKKKQGQRISFNTWLIKCISSVVERYPEIHGVRKGKNKIIIYDDVDISIMVEREIAGEKVPLPYIIRKANKKNIAEIQSEIKAARNQSINDTGDYVLGEKKSDLYMKLYYIMPGFIRRAIWQYIIYSPLLTKNNMGTVIITSVGMAGRINGWVIPSSVHPLAFAVGSIIKKPGVVNGNIEVREYLYMTVAVDHDIIDGAPAVRALSKLTDLIEHGYGLE